MFLGEMRSFYCDMFGLHLYLILAGSGAIQVAEVIVNPETTGIAKMNIRRGREGESLSD